MKNDAAPLEEALLLRLKKGDQASCTEIYNRYWRKLLAIGFYFTHNKQEAEDIVHEVMASLWSRKNELNINALEPYLATAVKFAVFKSIAQSKRQNELLKRKEDPASLSEIEEKSDARFLEEYLQGKVEQ